MYMLTIVKMRYILVIQVWALIHSNTHTHTHRERERERERENIKTLSYLSIYDTINQLTNETINQLFTHTHTHTHREREREIHTVGRGVFHLDVCVCVCVCVCVDITMFIYISPEYLSMWYTVSEESGLFVNIYRPVYRQDPEESPLSVRFHSPDRAPVLFQSVSKAAASFTALTVFGYRKPGL